MEFTVKFSMTAPAIIRKKTKSNISRNFLFSSSLPQKKNKKKTTYDIYIFLTITKAKLFDSFVVRA